MIREKQVQALRRMLAANSTDSNNFNSSENDVDLLSFGQWKVLVYDTHCRDIISPVFSVTALRQLGITLHMLIDSERQPITDVPAVYFCLPSENNIRLITRDVSQQMYRSFHLNFATHIERESLESLAKSLADSNSASLISSVYDQYLDFVSLESNLFSLNMAGSYFQYNDPAIKDPTSLDNYVQTITTGLVSVLRTFSSIPIIKTSNGISEMISRRLCTVLKPMSSASTARSQSNTLFSKSSQLDGSRLLLLVLDRNLDLVSPLSHAASYGALVNDVLDFKLNRISLPASLDEPGKRSYCDVDASDDFWSGHAGELYPDAVSAHTLELTQVKAKEQELRSRSTVDGDDSSANADTDNLVFAVESLPSMLRKIQTLSTHASVLQAIMTQLSSRALPSYFDAETNIIRNRAVMDKRQVMDLLSSSSKGSLNDRMRLLGIIILSCAILRPGDLLDFENAVTASTTSTVSDSENGKAVDTRSALISGFVREMKKMRAIQGFATDSQALESSVASVAAAVGSSLLRRATNLISDQLQTCQVLNIIDRVCNGKAYPDWLPQLITLDPKLKDGVMQLEDERRRYSDVIVFIVGGGCYSEYYSLQQSLPNFTKRVAYGGSEILNSEGLLKQICQTYSSIN